MLEYSRHIASKSVPSLQTASPLLRWTRHELRILVADLMPARPSIITCSGLGDAAVMIANEDWVSPVLIRFQTELSVFRYRYPIQGGEQQRGQSLGAAEKGSRQGPAVDQDTSSRWILAAMALHTAYMYADGWGAALMIVMAVERGPCCCGALETLSVHTE